MTAVGIVLAGGLSRRFGSPKALARMGDKYFYETAVDALHPACEDVVVVSHSDLLHHTTYKNVIIDLPEFAGCGPLAGILSAMEFVEADRYVVLPCDMPFVTVDVIQQLMTHHVKGITAVVLGERQHPLVSVWDRSVKTLIKNALQTNQLSVLKLLEKTEVTWIAGNLLTENAEFIFTNVNTPDALER